MINLSTILKDVYNEKTVDLPLSLQKMDCLESLTELPVIISETEHWVEGESGSTHERGEGRLREKRLVRGYTSEYTGKRLSVTTVRNLYLVAHLTRADISLMNDFEDFKDKLSIVGKEFVTMGKGFEYDGCNVFLRDTMLLAPGSQKSLKAIGNLYGSNFNKKELTQHEITNMDELLSKNKTKFLEYSKMDAVIPLIHALSMEMYN